MKTIRLNKKGISPIIATVIIVAVAIGVSISVAYWVTGIVPAFTRYEELKIGSCYIDDSTTTIIVIKNTGSSDATIDSVHVNGRLPETAFSEVTLSSGSSTTLTIGATEYTEVTGDSFISGVTYGFTVHTVAGGSYPASTRASEKFFYIEL